MDLGTAGGMGEMDEIGGAGLSHCLIYLLSSLHPHCLYFILFSDTLFFF